MPARSISVSVSVLRLPQMSVHSASMMVASVRPSQASELVAHRVVELLLDVALDVVLHPVGAVRGELRDEVVRVRHRGDAVADGELALERLLRGVVFDAEELAEVEPGLVDVVVVVLDESGAPVHHALAERVHELRVVLVVGDGDQTRPLVVPGKRVFIVTTARLAHGGGERGEGGLWDGGRGSGSKAVQGRSECALDARQRLCYRIGNTKPLERITS